MENKWIYVKDRTSKIDNHILVECIVEIRDNKTGEIREYETQELLGIGEEYPSVFNWGENNYSCDCNRRLFFKRVENEETDEDWDMECSNGKFSVNLKNKKDGEIYYREF